MTKGLDFEWLHNNGDKFITVEDYVPLHLSPYYDNMERYYYLKSKGLYEKIRKIEEDKREDFVKASDKLAWNIQDINSFIKKYDEFKAIIND